MRENIKVYLAGGLRTNWREDVILKAQGNFTFINPKYHGLEDNADQYTAWDLFYVKNCDILFGYMEQDNKSGYGLSLEIGYARALDKTIILIDERSEADEWFKRKYEIVRSASNVNIKSLELGIEFLNSFSNNKAIVRK